MLVPCTLRGWSKQDLCTHIMCHKSMQKKFWGANMVPSFLFSSGTESPEKKEHIPSQCKCNSLVDIFEFVLLQAAFFQYEEPFVG